MNRPFFNRLFLLEALAEGKPKPRKRKSRRSADIPFDLPLPPQKIQEHGVYRCACCDLLLFTSHARFATGTGWASFWAPVAEKNLCIVPMDGVNHGRLEIVCPGCQSHLGYLFDDGPTPTGRRFSVMLSTLKFTAKK